MKYDPLVPYHLELSPDNLAAVLGHAEEVLLKATHNFEVAVELECRYRQAYYEKYNACLLSLLSGAEKIGEKIVAQSVAEKTARAMCGSAYVDYENSINRAKVAEEKMNSIKKLLDQRIKLGG